MPQIQSVALDSSSLTSATLTRVLFGKFWGTAREFSSAPPNLEQMLSTHDAALLIGDPALKVDRSRYYTWDLAEEWVRLTGKPFVFAFWAVREQALRTSTLDLALIFQRSRDHGLEPRNLEQITPSWSARLGLTEESLRDYLTKCIFYYLDDSCLDGLRLFYRYAHECDALPRAPELNFAAAPSPALIST
jgi:chorismate dehydratase